MGNHVRNTCRIIFARLSSFFIVLGLAAVALLTACATSNIKPLHVPNLAYLDTGENAYIWNHGSIYGFGLIGGLTDHASITRIDGFELPLEYINRIRLLEIPAGERMIEITYSEERLCGVYCAYAEKARETFTFTAMPDRIYAPFARDKCSREWIWIEDLGPYLPDSNKQLPKSSMKKVVAGSAPDEHSCARQ